MIVLIYYSSYNQGISSPDHPKISYDKKVTSINDMNVTFYYSVFPLQGRNYTLISTSTPEGSSSFMRASTVFAVEL